MEKHQAVVSIQQLLAVRNFCGYLNDQIELSSGSRIYYDRAFLLSRRDSPMTRSPPSNLPFIPEGL
jgi:hypothetical protein